MRVARAGGAGHTRPEHRAVDGSAVLTAVSSTTNEVCSELSSLPVNLSVTVWPAKLRIGEDIAGLKDTGR